MWLSPLEYLVVVCYTSNMEYAYIAGFLDGEGSIRKYEVWRDRTKVRTTPRYGFEVVFWNTEKEPLEVMKQKLQVGTFSKRPTKNRTMYGYHIRKMEDIKKILPKLIPHLIIKKEKALKLLEDIQGWQSRQMATHR